MEKDKIFFAESGLTTTSANYTANVAKECYRLLDNKLSKIKFYDTRVGLVSSAETKLLNKGIDTEQLNIIENSLESIAKLKSLIAWLREAIKAKDRMIKEANLLTDEDCAKALGIILPEKPVKEDSLDEDDVLATYNIKKRNRILYLNTVCAEIGSFIHIDGTLSKERIRLQEVLSEPNKLDGNGRDTLIYTYDPSVPSTAVDEVYFSLQKKYREYQAEYNSALHEIQTTVQEANRKIDLEYSQALTNYCNEIEAIQPRLKAYKDEQIHLAQSLKITIPDSLKTIYEEVSQMVKK